MHLKLLVVEDEPHMREALTDYFTAKGYTVTTACDGEQALERIGEADFDLVFLDVMMPRLDGFTVCRQIRRSRDVPILFLTARGEEEDILKGYAIGADDYIVKPFSLAVLQAKAQALLERAHGGASNQAELTAGGITVRFQERSVTVGGAPVVLQPKTFDLLVCLMQNRGRVLSRSQLLDLVWGYSFFGDERVVDTHVKKLRRALGEYASSIHTVLKAGYRFEEGRG